MHAGYAMFFDLVAVPVLGQWTTTTQRHLCGGIGTGKFVSEVEFKSENKVFI